MANHYLVVSDLHLCDFEDHADGWMAHKATRFAFDDAFDSLVKRFCARLAAEDQATLVLNGDILDFDLLTRVPATPPWPVSSSERQRGLAATPEKSAWKAGEMLAAHPRFVSTLASFLAVGHQVVFVMGNHDMELIFPEVQAVIRSAISAAAPEGAEVLTGLRFEPWFYYVPGEIYAEHGQQYSYYTSFKDLHCPTISSNEGPLLALPMGNLSNRFLMTKMGFFNPHASDFILNLFAYFWHWLRYYAFSRRSLAWVWFWGSLVVMGRLLRIKKGQLRQESACRDALAVKAAQCGVEVAVLEGMERLQQPPITNRFFRIVREFWIDRLLLLVLMVGGGLALILTPTPLWVKFMIPLCVFPLVYLIYEAVIHGDTIFSIEKETPRVARQIAERLPAKVVTMGHDHVPRLLPLGREVTFVDTGTWAPIFKGESGQLARGYRNYLMATFREGELSYLFLGSDLP